jgi:hypothetical protein
MLSAPAVQAEFKTWDMQFDSEMEKFGGRTLEPEKILQGNNRSCSYSLDNADWGSSFRLAAVLKLNCSFHLVDGSLISGTSSSSTLQSAANGW